MRAAVLLGLCACAPAPLLEADLPTATPADATRYYTLWLGGARVGTATEHEHWGYDGVQLVRDERLHFARGDAEVALTTTIVVDADAALVARRVRWTELGPSGERSDEAVRVHGAWQHGGGALAGDAVPAELVPLLVRRDGAFTGDVFLPARGFAAGAGRVEPIAPHQVVARIALASGPTVEAAIALDRDGSPARVVDGEGVIALRATAEQAREDFAIADLVDITAVPIEGSRRGARLVLAGDLALPPLPGQAVEAEATGVRVDLSASLAGALPAGAAGPDRARDIRALVGELRDQITPDLGAARPTGGDATTATAGDCTTFALAYTALADRRGIPTRVVTGLRVDGDRLVRHRWAVSWTGLRWIAVDAAFGAAPAGGDLIGLAVHGADDAGLVAGEAALTRVRSARWD